MCGRITRVFNFTFEGQFLLFDLQLSEARDGIFQWPTDQDASMHLPAPKLFGGSHLGDPHGPKCQGGLGVPAWERGLPYRQGCIRRQGASEVAPAAGRQAVGGGYCRLQMPLKPALGVRGTVAGHRLSALEGPPSDASLHTGPVGVLVGTSWWAHWFGFPRGNCPHCLSTEGRGSEKEARSEVRAHEWPLSSPAAVCICRGGCAQGPWNLQCTELHENARDGVQKLQKRHCASTRCGITCIVWEGRAVLVSGQTERAVDICECHGNADQELCAPRQMACGGAFCTTNSSMIHRTQKWIGQK